MKTPATPPSTIFAWLEGFADTASQSQSAGALIEMVSFFLQLGSPCKFHVE